jgi:hypothetical protein
MRTILALLMLAAATPAHAWNALGHKVIADIAWEELDAPTREQIVDTLRRHPRFDEDFAKQLPADAEEDRWIFQQAAVWPDMARGFQPEDRVRYDHPTWHYVNFPLFVGGERPLLGVNLSMEYPTAMEGDKWNGGQAVKHCLEGLESTTPRSEKAFAYCWLFHLVGDIHQPMHSTALFSERFPTGDRGGNLIPVVQGRNLHSLWDGLLGRRDRPNDVKREVAKLGDQQTIWKVDTECGVEDWIQESHNLAKSFAYSPEIIAATEKEGELERINLPQEYLTQAGMHAQARVVSAGLRLAALLRTNDMEKD